jgi:hypothetical protein
MLLAVDAEVKDFLKAADEPKIIIDRSKKKYEQISYVKWKPRVCLYDCMYV